MWGHFLITLLNFPNDLIVSLINLLEEGFLELFLELNQSSECIEHIALAEKMVLMALTFLTTALKGRFLARFLRADSVDIEATLALELGLGDGFEDWGEFGLDDDAVISQGFVLFDKLF